MLDLTDIRREYPGVTALRDVSVRFEAGRTTALLGKNGAGKSTLVKILCGAERPDAGTYRILDQPVHLTGPADALARGIATVHQELSVVPTMSVLENIVLGRWPTSGGWLRPAEARRAATEAIRRLGVQLPLDALAGRLSVAEQQLVELARAIARDARFLILDEPTSSLSPAAVDALLDVVRRCNAQGVGVLYISHRLDEIQRIADRVVVLRDGRLAGDLPAAEADVASIVHLMAGTNVEHEVVSTSLPAVEAAPVVLRVDNLQAPPRVRSVSFTLHRGEVLGLAGVLGSGRTETLEILAGVRRRAGGTIEVSQRPFPQHATVRSVVRSGLALAPEDRRTHGIVPLLGVDENLVLPWLRRFRLGPLLRRSTLATWVRDQIRAMGIKTASPGARIGTLSGGNQQKVVIGRWLGGGIPILLLDEPTRGIDIEAKDQIFRTIRSVARDGVAVLVVSSELEELLYCCDSVVRLADGRTGPKISTGELDRVSLMRMVLAGGRHD